MFCLLHYLGQSISQPRFRRSRYSLFYIDFHFTVDTKLMDVKLGELPAWIARREKTPGAFYNEFMRNIWRVHNKWYSGPVYANTVSRNKFLWYFSKTYFFLRYPIFLGENYLPLRLCLLFLELAGQIPPLSGFPKDYVPLVEVEHQRGGLATFLVFIVSLWQINRVIYR